MVSSMLRDPASYNLTHPPPPTGWYTYDGPYTASRFELALRLTCTPIDAAPLPSCRSWADGRHRLSELCSVRAGLLVSLPPGAPPAHAAHHRRRLLCARSHRFILLARVRARGYSPSIDGTPTTDMVRAPTASAHATPAALDLRDRRPSRARVPCPRHVPPLASVTPFVRLRVRQ